MARTLPVSVVTPERVAWEGELDSLVIPAFDGQLGVLPGHAPLLAQMKPGTVTMSRGEEVRLLAVSGGFVEVRAGRVVILAETAEMAEDIDLERARLAAQRARQALKAHGPEKLDTEALASLERALARLHASEFAARRFPKGRPKPRP